MDLILDLLQAFQQQRIKHAAFSIQDHAHSHVVRLRVFVYTRTHQRIVHIDDRNHLGYDWNFFTF